MIVPDGFSGNTRLSIHGELGLIELALYMMPSAPARSGKSVPGNHPTMLIEIVSPVLQPSKKPPSFSACLAAVLRL